MNRAVQPAHGERHVEGAHAGRSRTSGRRRRPSGPPVAGAAAALALLAGGVAVVSMTPYRATDAEPSSTPLGVSTSAYTAPPTSTTAVAAEDVSVVSADQRTPVEPAQPSTPPVGPGGGVYAGFLSAPDLPQAQGVGRPWVGTVPRDARRNPSATPCDDVRFSVRGVREEQARIFVVPRARRLPASFGLSETLGRFPSPRSAGSFVDRVASRLASCESRMSSATVSEPHRFRTPDLSGSTWNLTFELKQGVLRYRMGVVQRGDRVAQIAFSPTPAHDVRTRAFTGVVERAGERLADLGRPADRSEDRPAVFSPGL